VVTSPEAYRLLLERTHTVWLKATPEVGEGRPPGGLEADAE